MSSPEAWQVLNARLSIPKPHDLKIDTVVERPTLEQVLSLFEKLGNSEGGDLYISGSPGERCLMIAGGPSCYLVSCIGDDYGAYNLIDPTTIKNRDEWMTLHAGGVPCAVQVADTVRSELARLAICHYHTYGAIDPQLRWE